MDILSENEVNSDRYSPAIIGLVRVQGANQLIN